MEDAVENLDDAIDSLQASLTSFQSTDPSRLTLDLKSPDDTEFFEDEEDAVEAIFDAIYDGEITNTTLLIALEQIVVDLLLEADKRVAQTAIDDAVAANGDPVLIAEAQAEFGAAELQVSAGLAVGISAEKFFDDAVESFEEAWIKAQQAVEELLECKG